MIRFFYTVLLICTAPLFLFGLYRKKPGKPSVGQRWKEHFGITPKVAGKSPVWIHAVSVGEVIAISPFIKALKQQRPELAIVLTTTTPTGAEQAKKLGNLVEHRYMPLDFPWCLKWFIDTVKPSQLIIMETELWPNTLAIAAKNGVPVSVVNARLSQRSCDGYAKVKFLFHSLFARHISHIYCQYAEDAKRFEFLGIASEKLTVTGSMKFDITVPETAIATGKILREQLGNNRPVWIAASTHKGEDEQVLQVHRQLIRQLPDAVLILVPRHPERFDSVASLVKEQGWSLSRRTEAAVSELPQAQVYLADTMGEMFTFLAASDVCFMGGSLLGDKVGGHNLLEPAAVGIPSITGPSYFNFTDITNNLVACGGGMIAQNGSEITAQLVSILSANANSARMKNALDEFIKSNQGAIRKTINGLNFN